MSFENWLFLVKTAEKTSVKRATAQKFHYKWASGREMVEEYNLDTGMLTHRRWKKESLLRNGLLEWDIEVGEPTRVERDETGDEELLTVANEPVLTKRITRHNIEWRIKNLSYPLETYSVTVEPETCEIVVRTSNKKYYKRIKMLELERCKLKPEPSGLTVKHQVNTLIVAYKKPALVKDMEAAVQEILNTVVVEDSLNFDVEELLGNLS